MSEDNFTVLREKGEYPWSIGITLSGDNEAIIEIRERYGYLVHCSTASRDDLAKWAGEILKKIAIAREGASCKRCACPCGNSATCGCSDPASPYYLPPGHGINEEEKGRTRTASPGQSGRTS